jgi:hypothetical protein
VYRGPDQLGHRLPIQSSCAVPNTAKSLLIRF